MADCLSCLRQYNIQKKEIVERDDLIIFDNIAWPRTARTNYLMFKIGDGPKEYYTLESLLFLLKNVNLSHPMYVQRAGNQNVPVIKFPDRRGLLSYLNGEVETTPSIDRSVHLEMGISMPSSKRSLDEPHQEPSKKPRYSTESDEIKADKQRLAVKLETNKRGGGAITDQIRPLSETMSKEKIAAIRIKRLAKKRATIKDDDIDRDADHSYLDDATHSIVKRERCHKTRTSVLQSSTKTFTNIFNLLQTVKSKEEGKVDSVNKQTIQPMEEKVVKPRPPKYNRYGQESFGKEATGEFSIVTTGSYHGMTLETMTEVASKPIAETPLPKSKIIPEVKDTIVDVPLSRKKSQSRTPIIIVPSAPSSIITIYNCREFLEEFKYVPSEEKKKGGMKRSSDITIYRKKPHPSYPGQTISKPFKVTDNPLRLNRQEWEQVVAVFVAGPTWQFKGWPDMVAGGSPVDIFTKMKGFHVKFDEAKLDNNIHQWDVEVLQISKTKRHLDKASMLRFWDIMERFMTKCFPDLRF